MSHILPELEWDALAAEFEWLRDMRGCPQDALYHAEGDVWTHVRMVWEVMRGAATDHRDILLAAALLHDVAKPACTRHENGRITSRGHSQRGAVMGRRILWERGVEFQAREQVCALIRYHQSPLHWMERADASRLVHRISQTARCDLLTQLARADVVGRICADQDELLTRVGLFGEFCAEQACLHSPRAFASELSRFEYFRTENRDPNYCVHDSTKCEVVLMSGLPGAGKDTWIRKHAGDWPVISLDDIREDIGAEPTGNQGAVVQEARERARVLLRQNTSFVWNATNLSREMRTPLIDLFTAYQARTRIVYVESPCDRLFAQNREREAVVPPGAIRRMMDRWEVPDPAEAWRVDSYLT